MLAGAHVPDDVLLVGHPHFPSQVARPLSSDLPTYKQVFEQEDYRIDLPLRPRHIVDLGANVGYSVAYFHHAYPDARIVAVEPDKENYELARLNASLAGATKRATIVHSGIWHSPTHIRIVNPSGNAWAYRIDSCAADAPGALRSVTMGQLMQRYDLPVVDLVKIDIEAGERFLFAANTEWLDHVNALIIEFHDRFTPGCREPVIDALDRHFGAYTEKTYGENTLFVREEFVGSPQLTVD